MRTGLKEIFTTLVDDDVPVAFRGCDGTITGPRSPIATVEVRSPAAVGYIVTAPGELGLARAYALQGDNAQAKTAYQDFLKLWKDADSNLFILKQAQAESAKLS